MEDFIAKNFDLMIGLLGRFQVKRSWANIIGALIARQISQGIEKVKCQGRIAHCPRTAPVLGRRNHRLPAARVPSNHADCLEHFCAPGRARSRGQCGPSAAETPLCPPSAVLG